MPKAATHTVAGAVGTRKSPRTYTHATVVTYDPVWYAKHLAPARLDNVKLRAVQHWDHVANALANTDDLMVKAKAEDARFTTQLNRMAPGPASTIYERALLDDVKEARALLIRFGTRDAYVAAELVAEKQRLDKEYLTGVVRYVLSWHQSPVAAAAFARTEANRGRHACVEVCHVIRS